MLPKISVIKKAELPDLPLKPALVLTSLEIKVFFNMLQYAHNEQRTRIGAANKGNGNREEWLIVVNP